jgi:hypothetical protein
MEPVMLTSVPMAGAATWGVHVDEQGHDEPAGSQKTEMPE